MRRHLPPAFVLLSLLALTASASFARDGNSPSGSSSMPAGHPSIDGHTEPTEPSNPHALFDAPQDKAMESPDIAAGSIRVRLRTALGDPVTNQMVILGILSNSVAKGEHREQQTIPTDDHGQAIFSGLSTASGTAYRVRAFKDGAVFFAPPFPLSEAAGYDVLLHVYPVAKDIKQAKVAMEAMVFAEVRDDRIQFEEVFNIYNLGMVAWLAEDVSLSLPKDATAIQGQTTMSDQSVVPIIGQGASLRGTFAPGQHSVTFKWQLPYGGQEEVTAHVGLPPHVAVMRVATGVIPGATLSANGFPAATLQTSQRGDRFLVTERQFRPGEEPTRTLSLTLSNLPAPGLGRVLGSFTYEQLVASVAGLAALGTLLWAVWARRGATNRHVEQKARILADLGHVEEGHLQGEIGPQTYDRTKRELVDELALLLRLEEPQQKKGCE